MKFKRREEKKPAATFKRREENKIVFSRKENDQNSITFKRREGNTVFRRKNKLKIIVFSTGGDVATQELRDRIRDYLV